jgi:PII-like signaling protein
MLAAGAMALKVTVHLNEDTSDANGFLHAQILAYLQQQGIDGASVIRPHAGFGAHRKLHTQGAGPVHGEHLPVLIVFVEEARTARQILPALLDMVSDGLVEAHPVEVLKNVATPQRVIRS